jgi:hypothetical protein
MFRSMTAISVFTLLLPPSNWPLGFYGVLVSFGCSGVSLLCWILLRLDLALPRKNEKKE